MNKSLLVCCGVLALAGVACNNDPAKGKTRAAVGEATATSQQTLQAPANGANYGSSQAGSSVDFVGAKVTKKHDGKIGGFNGAFLYDLPTMGRRLQVRRASRVYRRLERLRPSLLGIGLYAVAVKPDA